MPRRLTRILLLPVLLFAGQAMALGLGEIRLSSALNEPLRAEIDLLSAAPEELSNLTVQLASPETFERYGLDRPLFLGNLTFEVIKSGTSSGNLIRVRSHGVVSEPFVTFLVEAVWSRGRLLREYTLLLDPPTFAPPPTTPAPAVVTAPTRATQTDAGRIQRQTPSPPVAATPHPSRSSSPSPAQSEPAEMPAAIHTESPAAESEQAAVEYEAPPPQPFDSMAGDDLLVQRGDTLWGIASRVRPDSRLTMNQMMMALYEANPEAFSGNINRLRAGSMLRIPSADDIYRISRGDALSAVRRQHADWQGGIVSTESSEPGLILVPPDEDQTAYDESSGSSDLSYSRETEIEDRIRDLEADVPTQDSLIEIRDNELAQLRAELARMRGEEPPELPVDDELVVDDADAMDGAPVDDDEIFADDGDDDLLVDEAAADEDTAADVDEAADAEPPPVVAMAKPKPSLVDTVLGYVMSFWGAITGAILLVLGILVWFARRAGRQDDESTGLWESLDADELDGDDMQASTARLSALARDDDASIVVVEQESKAAMAAEMVAEPPLTVIPAVEPQDDAALEQSLDDTFSSETAINLDQSDPIAEADFHMAYGLHDQAADLINGALEVEPGRQDLLAKLCEVYFVWGNRDSFVDAAQNMKNAVGDGADAEWDKIIIMGQQIAADHELFSGKTAGAATKAVDLSFDDEADKPAELDMDFAGGPDSEVSDVVDLGAASGTVAAVDEPLDSDASSIDFNFEETDSAESITQEMPSETPDSDFGEMSADDAVDGLVFTEETGESPILEQPDESLDATAEVPSIAADEVTEIAGLEDELPVSDQTAEINLDDLGLDLDSLTNTGMTMNLDDAVTVEADLDATAESATLVLDDLDVTGESLAMDELDSMAETGKNPALDSDTVDDDFGINTTLLDVTGQTLVLGDDFAVETGTEADTPISDLDETRLASSLDDNLPDDAEVLMAPLLDEDNMDDFAQTEALLPADVGGDFDFAKTEALPADVFTSDLTGELPSPAGSTDMDLDLDDLTAALKVNEVGDTVNQMRDEATVEQPRVRDDGDLDAGLGGMDDVALTQELASDEFSSDLHDARTMTEVGTKLDLARAYVDMGDPTGAKSILEEVLNEGDDSQRQQARQLLDSLPS